MNAVLAHILRDRLIAVVRTDSAEILPDLVQALVGGGISIIEITLTIPNAVDAIQQLDSFFGDRVVIGAGTVLHPQEAEVCIRAGAKFIVSPIGSKEVIATAKKHDTPVMPGAFTPTEVSSAIEAGADIVKLFPADTLGPSYLKALRGPFPHARLMPTGGVDLTTIPQWLAAGACCLGVGGQLIDRTLLNNRDWAALTDRARQFRDLVPIRE